MLDGSSSVNAMLYVRGVKEDYNEWNITGWSFNDVLPYFKKSEGNKYFFPSTYHNINGPLSVENYGSDLVINSGILGGVQEFGYKILNDYSQDQHIGFCLVQGTLLNSERCSAARAFLSPTRNRSNLKVIKNVRVTSLIINNNKVEGVNFSLRGKISKQNLARK